MRQLARSTTLMCLASSLALLLAATSALPALGSAVGTGPSNPGFEQGLDGWKVSGYAGAAMIESGGRTGDRLTHWAAADYHVTTRQSVELPSSGWWTVSVWAKSGGSLNGSTLSVTGCGRTVSTVVALTEQDDAWVRSAVSVYASGRQRCTIDLTTAGPGGTWASFDDLAVGRGRVARSIRGGDLSGLAKKRSLWRNLL